MTQQPLFQPPITLSELEYFLWEAANILRGSPVESESAEAEVLKFSPTLTKVESGGSSLGE